MKKLVVGFVSAAALAVIGVAAAGGNTAAVEQQSSDNSNNAAGVFVSGNLGYGYVGAKYSDYNLNTADTLDRGGFAWNGNIGYQFNRYIALEGGYTHFGQVKASRNAASLTSSLAGFGFDVKGIMPLNSQFDLFAKAGAVDMHESFETNPTGTGISKLNGSAWTPELGLGASYNVTDNVAVSLQDVYAFRTTYKKTVAGVSSTVHVPEANAVLAGVSYKFTV